MITSEPYNSCILSLSLSLILTPLVKFLAVKNGWLAYPQKERWHQKATALFGGIAIYLSFSIPLLFYVDFTTIIPHIIARGVNPLSPPSFISVVFIGVSFLFILGLIDDLLHIKPHSKLVGQIIVAALITYLGFRLHWFESLSLDTMITIIWIIGITNAFNLIDNMDGLCAGVALIAALLLAGIFFDTLQGETLVALLLSGAIAGFLVFNFNPASIFMGDCGSLFIGFTLSMLTLSFSSSGPQAKVSAYAVPVMILIVPIFDTTMVTIIRILSGRKASTGGKDHTSHRLVLLGLSERNAVLFLYGIGVVSGAAALFVNKTDTMTSPAVIIPLILSVVLMGIYLAQLRVYPEKEFSSLRNRPYTPILLELTYKKQILLVILDLCIIAFSYYLSYRLLFESKTISLYFDAFLSSLPVIIGCKIVVFFFVGVYRGIWQYMSSNDVFVYIKASLLGSLFSVAFVAVIFPFDNFPKSIIFIDWLITTGLILGTRGSFRIFLDAMKSGALEGDKVVLYGAGRGGEILLRELLNNKSYRLKPIGFIDDDPLKKGKKILGYPILGKMHDLTNICEQYQIKGIIISYRKSKKNDEPCGIKEYCNINNLFLKKLNIDLSDF